jgi:hypothetical protein
MDGRGFFRVFFIVKLRLFHEEALDVITLLVRIKRGPLRPLGPVVL